MKKLLSLGTLANVWHQTLTSLQLLEKALQLVLDQLMLLACHPGHLPNTLYQLEVIKNACDNLLQTAVLADGSVLC